jgi:hypothetical protein
MQTGWGFWVPRSVGSGRLVLLRCYSIFIFMQLCAAAFETWSEAEKSMRLSFQSDAFLCDSVQRKREVCLWPFQGGALPMSYPGTPNKLQDLLKNSRMTETRCVSFCVSFGLVN